MRAAFAKLIIIFNPRNYGGGKRAYEDWIADFNIFFADLMWIFIIFVD